MKFSGVKGIQHKLCSLIDSYILYQTIDILHN